MARRKAAHKATNQRAAEVAAVERAALLAIREAASKKSAPELKSALKLLHACPPVSIRTEETFIGGTSVA